LAQLLLLSVPPPRLFALFPYTTPFRTELVAYRTNGDETSLLTIGSFGTNITLTGNFTGLDGDYIFGPSAAFVDCPGSTTYTSSGWNNGAPTSSMMAIIDEDYSTTIANIDACSLVI